MAGVHNSHNGYDFTLKKKKTKVIVCPENQEAWEGESDGVKPLFGKLWGRKCLCVHECGTMYKCAHLICTQVWDSVHIGMTDYTICCVYIMSVYVCMSVGLCVHGQKTMCVSLQALV